MPQESGKIRNVAVLGHRGSGKTSLVESLLFESGATTRLGSVADGTTVTDHDEDEKRRSMSISASLAHCAWEGRRLNLIDTPGDPSFQGDALGALRVVEGSIFEISGVAGVEVSTDRLWRRADELNLPRLVHVNLLDRERADFDAALASLKRLSDWVVAVAMPMGQEHDYGGVIDLVHMKAYPDAGGGHEGDGVEIPEAYREEAQRRHDELIEKVAESADELIEKYLEGEEITAQEMAEALKAMVSRGTMFPVTCGAATRNSGTHALLDLIVEALPSPKRAGGVKATTNGGEELVLNLDDGTVAYVFKTIADPFAGKLSLFRVFSGTVNGESHLLNQRTHAKERMGALLDVQGKEHHAATEFAAGEIGAVGKLKDVTTGDLLVDSERDLVIAPVQAALAGRLGRRRAVQEGRGGQAQPGAAAAPGGGPDARRAPRRPHRRAARRGPLADAHRGDRRPRQAPVRRRHDHAPAAGARTSRRSGRRRAATAGTRSRPAAAGSSATATSRSSRFPATRATSSTTRSSAA